MMAQSSYTLSELREKANGRRVPVCLPVSSINILTQVRKTMDKESIKELADSLADKGQMEPGLVAALTKSEASKYVSELNKILGASHKFVELKSIKIDGKIRYLTVVAGHRRYIACELLYKEQRFTANFDGGYRAVLLFGITADMAIELQFQENNTRRRVPPHENAEATSRMYWYKKDRDPSMTLASFARSIGRSSSWVKDALRFCTLPDSLQEFARGENGRPIIRYGILAQAARLKEGSEETGKSIDDSSLLRLVLEAEGKKVTVATFAKQVSARLEHLRNAQGELFSEITESKRPMRRVVAPELTKDVWRALSYLKTLNALQESGAFNGEHFIGPETDKKVLEAYSPGSPLHLMSEFAGEMGNMLPNLEELAHNYGRYVPAITAGEEPVAEAGQILNVLVGQEG